MFVFLGTVWWAATHMVVDLLVYHSQKVIFYFFWVLKSIALSLTSTLFQLRLSAWHPERPFC
jgi:hypothetical protein